MNILAFDTCLDKMYVALGNENEVVSSKIVETTQTNYHSAFLISTITEILEQNGLAPEDVDVIASNIGPGSFTGIRACTTVARVMAQGLDKKTVGVSSLEILSRINSGDKKTFVALDARKDMAYVAIYDGKSGEEIQSPQAILMETVKKMLSAEDYFVVTDNKLLPVLGGLSYQDSDCDFGKYLVEIAAKRVLSGKEEIWQKLLPLYIQPPGLNLKAVKK